VNLGTVAPPPVASASGCATDDFAAFERDFVALVRRRTCTLQVKVENAVGASAAAVLIMSEGTDVPAKPKKRPSNHTCIDSEFDATRQIRQPFEEGQKRLPISPVRSRALAPRLKRDRRYFGY